MSSISINNGLGIHPYALLAREHRAELLAGNIANADTPGYKAKDLDFKSALESVQNRKDFSLNKSHDKHFSATIRDPGNVQYRVPNQPDTGDGNTVDADVERSLYVRNAMEYQASLTFLNSRIQGMNKALRGQ